jgi:hypothetical protein
MMSKKSLLSIFDGFPDIILLSFCALGICTSYITYGFILEECFGKDNTVGSVTTFILITQSITNIWVAQFLISINKPNEPQGSLNHRLLIKSTYLQVNNNMANIDTHPRVFLQHLVALLRR